MGMHSCRLRPTGRPSDFAARLPSQLSTELWVWTRLTPCSRMSRRRRKSAPTTVALRIRIDSTGTEAARASRSSRLSGWHTISAFQPWPISQRASARVRISWPPRPSDDSVCRRVGMAADYRPEPKRAGCGSVVRLLAGLPAPAAAAAGPAAPAAATAEATAAATTAAAPVAAAPGSGSFGLLDLDGAAVEVGAVEAADGLLGFLRRRHFDEAEAPRTTGVPVSHDACGLDAARRRECLAQTLV